MWGETRCCKCGVKCGVKQDVIYIPLSPPTKVGQGNVVLVAAGEVVGIVAVPRDVKRVDEVEVAVRGGQGRRRKRRRNEI